MTTIREYYRKVRDTLAQALGDGEGEGAAKIIFEDVASYSPTFIFANGDREITDFTASRIDAVVSKVLAGEPVQYAVGKARFMGNDFEVSPAVLIPRPETAALVDMITDDFGSRSDLSVLDIGTGSGCIAISLGRALPFSKVEGIDISGDALAVARDNAKSLGVSVDFHKADILNAAVPAVPVYDIIVSNPPYVCESEASGMDARVLDYEPHTALFVPDSDPLLFYRAIARYAAKALRSGGRLYFEINSRFGNEMQAMLKDEGFSDVLIRRDFRGLDRYAVASL